MRILLSLLLLAALSSCSKESLTTPDKQTPAAAASAVLASYKDANINLVNFAAKSANAQVEVGFTVVFASDVKTFEILRGETPATLCSIYKRDVAGTNIINTSFSTIDTEPTTSCKLYYMVKYTLVSGDWYYTPVIELQTQTDIAGS